MGFRNGGGRWHAGDNKGIFGEPDRKAGTVPVVLGNGNVVEAKVGSDFVATVEQIAKDAHYGGYFRVFVNQQEIQNPGDAPKKIEEGQRLSITSYDKVG